ncbi:asparagine synthase (glutamine-hydrolyzing) [Empedobacter tilapiae]|uniref:asparagine synthase (glutamine-hydrolyzing) n=1 Tax=Empedobacter tilapiae TaxID=2491114 RepID=A0A4Z1BIT9_9FLAO|nr:asparagine synthase (glutamine-hydrolyzing) [Empedobacter tilapiae]TGN29374.1 asparagine synthase (glutamine-hydrolyzing) [Empedobacter tilapiae]
MCGISGIFSKDKLSDSSILNSLGSIKHRGTNNTIHSCFFEQDLHFYSSKLSDKRTQFDLKNSEGFLVNNWIGFNRLSILDLSNNGMQPFYENDAKIALTMNGEIYNFRELRKEFLLDKDFSSDSDTEVVFQLYLKLGDDFVHHLRGMFTIVIIDYKNNEAKIWRDRFGIKPFYYYLDDKYFIFSSETTGIFATDLVERSIDFKHLAYSFYLNSSFSPHTIYNNIYSLEAATKLEVDLTTLKAKKEIYWQLEYQPNNKSISKEEFLDDVCKLVNLASVADVKQAVMLSGGLDSGLLAYQFGKNKIDIEALTIYNTDVEEQNELEFAKSNAENAKLDLLSFKIENEVTLQTIKEYCLAEEEPNSSPEPAYFLSKKAFENKYTILHNALGLDELFYGYGYYHQAKKMQIIRPFLLKPFKYLLKGSKRHKYEEITRFGIEAAPFIMRSFSSWVAIQKLFSKYGSENWEHPISILMNKVRETNSNFEKMPLLKKISYLDFYYYISSHHSLRSDVPAMKNEIEMRFPYLDHLFVQKYFNISDLHQGLTKENNKPFLRKNVTNILPKDVLSMKKKGFSMPTSKWLESVNLEKDFPELTAVFGENYKNWMNHPSKKWFLISTSLLLK